MADFHNAQTPEDLPQTTEGTDEPEPPTPTEDEYRQYARKHRQREGECEIDENAVVSPSVDHGAYVQAWIWIDDTELA